MSLSALVYCGKSLVSNALSSATLEAGNISLCWVPIFPWEMRFEAENA